MLQNLRSPPERLLTMQMKWCKSLAAQKAIRLELFVIVSMDSESEHIDIRPYEVHPLSVELPKIICCKGNIINSRRLNSASIVREEIMQPLKAVHTQIKVVVSVGNEHTERQNLFQHLCDP